MYLDGYQCDNCEKIHNKGTNEIPSGWYKVLEQQEKPVRHFCSVICLSQWSSDQVRQHEKKWKYGANKKEQ